MADQKETKDANDTRSLDRAPLILDPCEKAHDAEHDRYQDDDGACDDGVN